MYNDFAYLLKIKLFPHHAKDVTVTNYSPTSYACAIVRRIMSTSNIYIFVKAVAA